MCERICKNVKAVRPNAVEFSEGKFKDKNNCDSLSVKIKFHRLSYFVRIHIIVHPLKVQFVQSVPVEIVGLIYLSCTL